MTTRPKREGEIDGRDYLFKSHDDFDELIRKNGFIEYEHVHDWYYGTPKEPIENWMKAGKVVFLDLDVLGALNLKKQFDRNIVLIFLKPPDEATLPPQKTPLTRLRPIRPGSAYLESHPDRDSDAGTQECRHKQHCPR